MTKEIEAAGAKAAEDVVETDATDPTPSAEKKRKTFSLGDKIKVVDLLRSRVEPFVDETKEGVARQVAEETGVDMQASSLYYLVDELPEFNLVGKLIVKTEPKLLEQQVKELERQIGTLNETVTLLTSQMFEMAANVQRVMVDKV